MSSRRTHPRRLDYEQVAFEAITQSQDEAKAKLICQAKLQSLEADIRPTIEAIAREISAIQVRSRALVVGLYDRPAPVSAGVMIALSVMVSVSMVALACLLAGSAVSHISTFSMLGYGIWMSALLGSVLTATVAVVGHLAGERILKRHRAVPVVLAVIGFGLCFFSLTNLAMARGAMADIAETTSGANATESFVDGEPAALASNADGESRASEAEIRQMVDSASVTAMLATDLALALIAAALIGIRSDTDFASWKALVASERRLGALERKRDELHALLDSARADCVAGILRGAASKQPKQPPYFGAMLTGVALLAMSVPTMAYAQPQAERAEVILLDLSGSVGGRSGSGQLFAEYLETVSSLLSSLPPGTRLWIRAVSTESFGDGPILAGWTPKVAGVFRSDLERARRELLAAFKKKAAELTPSASGTDLFGALWRAKLLIESQSLPSGADRSIYLISDGVHEGPGFVMPSLLPQGSEHMLALAKASGFVVPLQGVRLHVLGVAPRGQTPQQWLTVRDFWTKYAAAAGADLVQYSAETEVVRR